MSELGPLSIIKQTFAYPLGLGRHSRPAAGRYLPRCHRARYNRPSAWSCREFETAAARPAAARGKARLENKAGRLTEEAGWLNLFGGGQYKRR